MPRASAQWKRLQCRNAVSRELGSMASANKSLSKISVLKVGPHVYRRQLSYNLHPMSLALRIYSENPTFAHSARRLQ